MSQHRRWLALAAIVFLAVIIPIAILQVTDWGSSNQSAGSGARTLNFKAVGHFDLPMSAGFADVYAFGDYAYLGVVGGGFGGIPCPEQGISVVDISDPAHPRLASTLVIPKGTWAEDVVVLNVDTEGFTGEVAATGIQACGTGGGFRGLQFFDVTDPSSPVELGRWRAPSSTGGCHEIDLVLTKSGHLLAACALPDAETIYGYDEVVVVDATYPSAPKKAAGFGIGKDLGLDLGKGVGCDNGIFAHSVRWFDRGKSLYISYWDAGTLRMRVDARSGRMRVMSRTLITPRDEEGNNHSMTLADNGRLLLINPEDFDALPCGEGETGWGQLEIYANDDARPEYLATFGTPNSKSGRGDGFYAIHNSEVVDRDQVFAAWYSDGVRWIDLSDPEDPKQKGYFVPPPAARSLGDVPSGVAFVWGVWPHRGLVLASDVTSGLWILRPVTS